MFGDMATDNVKRLKQLQENNRLKKLPAEHDLEIEVMKQIAVYKWWAYSCVLSGPDMQWYMSNPTTRLYANEWPDRV